MHAVWLRYDLRSSAVGRSNQENCAVALEQVEWADKQGCFDTVALSEHHGSPDGYNPSPFVFGGAVAARTRHMRIHPSAMLLPYLDPVRVAEDAAVLDNISNGRLDITMGIGYLPSEMSMFGIQKSARAKLMDEKLIVLRRVLAGERFRYGERTVFTAPRPVQTPGPRIFIAGDVRASAERAAKYGDGFSPMALTPELLQVYTSTCAQLGKKAGQINDTSGAINVYVTEDPERAWPQVAPYYFHETQCYARWSTEGGFQSPFRNVTTLDALKAVGIYHVVTPDQCYELVLKQRAAKQLFTMCPLTSGLPAELSWPSLELFVSKVAARLSTRAQDSAK